MTFLKTLIDLNYNRIFHSKLKIEMPMLDCISIIRYKMNIFRLHLSILIIGCNFCLSEDEFNISELNLVDQTFYKLNSVVLDQGLIYQNINGNKLFLGRIIEGKQAGE